MNIREALIRHNNEFNRSACTLVAYNHGLHIFVEYLKENGVGLDSPLESVVPELFIGFPAWIGMRKYSKKTIGVYLSGVKSFMDWLVIAGVLELTYSQSIRWKLAVEKSGSKKESRLPRFPKREDAQKMIDGVRSMPEESPRKERNIALILLLASSGCRNDEVAKLKVGNVNLIDRSTVVTGKGNKERRVFFSQEAAEAIQVYLSLRQIDDSQPLFIRHDKGTGKKVSKITTTTIRNVVGDVATFAGVKPFSPHYFRHAFAINVLEKTHDLALVQDLLGHSSPTATRVYAKIYPESMKASYREVYG